MKEEPGGFVDGDEEPEEEEAAAAAADGDEEEEDEDDDGDELGYLHETTTQGGLAGALEMARGRGMLGADGPTSGRMFDQKGAGLHDYEADDGDGEGKAGYDATRLGRAEHTAHAPRFSHTPRFLAHDPTRLPHPTRRFELNYFDEYGRKMTQKQAFRQLSWKFHGKGPSKKRREKRMQVMGPPRTFAAAALPSSPARLPCPPARRPPPASPLIPASHPNLVRTWSARWTSHRRIARWTTWAPYSTPSSRRNRRTSSSPASTRSAPPTSPPPPPAAAAPSARRRRRRRAAPPEASTLDERGQYRR